MSRLLGKNVILKVWSYPNNLKVSCPFCGVHGLFIYTIIETVGGLYDLVDGFVADLSKCLHQMQVEQYAEYETRLAGIRRKAIEAETIEQSMNKFLNIMQQAFRQSFNNQEDSNNNFPEFNQ